MDLNNNRKEYQKQYYIKNRERLLAYSLSKKKCLICDRSYHISHFSRHLKTKKHKKKLEVYSK